MMKIFFFWWGGVEHLENVENDYKVRKMFFCESFKASTLVDCGPILFKRLALTQVFAPLQDKNIF